MLGFDQLRQFIVASVLEAVDRDRGCAASSSLIWVRGLLLMRMWPGDMMADGVNPALLRGCSFFPGRPPQAATTGRWRERAANIS